MIEPSALRRAIETMAACTYPIQPAIEILTADEVADLLRVNRKTIYEAAQRGEIPHRKLGRRLVFERGAVLAWLRQGERGLE